MKNLEQHVGKKVKGIKFISGKYDRAFFNNSMELYIGQEGVIEEYEPLNNTFKISFKSPESDYWFYPVEEILPQLLESDSKKISKKKLFIKNIFLIFRYRN